MIVQLLETIFVFCFQQFECLNKRKNVVERGKVMIKVRYVFWGCCSRDEGDSSSDVRGLLALSQFATGWLDAAHTQPSDGCVNLIKCVH